MAAPMPSTAPRAPSPATTAVNMASSRPGKATSALTAPVTSRPARAGSTDGSAPSTMPALAPMSAAASASCSEYRLGDEDAGEQVAAEVVGAERVRGRGALQDRAGVDQFGRVPQMGGPITASTTMSAARAAPAMAAGVRSITTP
ncbi:hypothetical protein ACFSTC_30825 [Nonomuraea ferruginea]